MYRVFNILMVCLLLSSCLTLVREVNPFADRVSADFAARKMTLQQSDYFDMFDDNLFSEQKLQALEYLYAYMPLSDLANYPSELFERSVEFTLSVRKNTSWAATIPDSIFMMYVLPIRVDREPLDSSRYAMLGDLHKEVSGLDMRSTVEAINYWCARKVSFSDHYNPLLSPLSVVSAASANNIEQSVLLVSALRTVGVPARVIKSGYWSDQPHKNSWVEAWVDGRWEALASCEPAPQFNQGWFADFSQIGYMVYFNIYGRYPELDNVISSGALSTTCNATERYLECRDITVGVEDVNMYRIDSYHLNVFGLDGAEITSIISSQDTRQFKKANRDAIVVARDYNRFGVSVIDSLSAIHSRTIVDHKLGERATFNFVLGVDRQRSSLPDFMVSQEQLHYVDSVRTMATNIREQYIANFISDEHIQKVAREQRYQYGTIGPLITRSRGNWESIVDILTYAAEADLRTSVINLLSQLTDQQLYSANFEVLKDHLVESPTSIYRTLRRDYIVNPTISDETISSYKRHLRVLLGEEFCARVLKNPMLLVEWIDNNKQIVESDSPLACPILPLAAYRAPYLDAHSRDILFVAICRSIGIAARIETTNNIVQFFHHSVWNSVDFESDRVGVPTGVLSLSYNRYNHPQPPAYGGAFMLYRIVEGDILPVSFGLGDNYNSPLNRRVMLSVGEYLLVRSDELPELKQSVRLEFFEIKRGITTYLKY